MARPIRCGCLTWASPQREHCEPARLIGCAPSDRHRSRRSVGVIGVRRNSQSGIPGGMAAIGDAAQRPPGVTRTPARHVDRSTWSSCRRVTRTPAVGAFRVTRTPALVTPTPARVTRTPALVTRTPALGCRRVTRTPAEGDCLVTRTPADGRQVVVAGVEMMSRPLVTRTPAVGAVGDSARVTRTPAEGVCRVTRTPDVRREASIRRVAQLLCRSVARLSLDRVAELLQMRELVSISSSP
ncbi:hypothetical protein TL08_07905 [Actinoalloteichus hymeniacidonis]|uniref:Uncharacterized protein n=1 Tax=Actinoalloteichus hymeniacidonis TaxID=340345 RepID=A0AAC9MWN3_9PSEU|nr:hypothetical protein TL08_07905 [Actinoalloteichus hymeniacidonis]